MNILPDGTRKAALIVTHRLDALKNNGRKNMFRALIEDAFEALCITAFVAAIIIWAL